MEYFSPWFSWRIFIGFGMKITPTWYPVQSSKVSIEPNQPLVNSIEASTSFKSPTHMNKSRLISERDPIQWVSGVQNAYYFDF